MAKVRKVVKKFFPKKMEEPIELVDPTYDFRVAVLGETESGKTSILRRLIYQQFYVGRVPLLMPCQRITFAMEQNKPNISLSLWDISPEPDVKKTLKALMKTKWFRSADAYILVFALDDEHSFDQLKLYVSGISKIEKQKSKKKRKVRSRRPLGPVLIIGNKSDVQNSRVIPAEMLREYFQDRPFFKCSAKDGSGVSEAFEILCGELQERFLTCPTKWHK